MNITLIGASGFIGTNLISLLKPGNKMVNIDKLPSSTHPELTVVANITDVNALRSAIPADTDCIIHLAAEHKDDVSPASLYYDVNVKGTENILRIMDEKNITRIIFTSSVAVYGLDKDNPTETAPVDPFNHYGKSKLEAEKVLENWISKAPADRSLVIIRPTVVFGQGNKGNVYNLLRQISTGKFLMIGNGLNKKSMAYVGNITAFLAHCLKTMQRGHQVYNYADKPDLTTRELIKQAEISLNKKLPPLRLPYALGYAGGMALDLAGKLMGKKFPISAVRVKKFCATTQFSAEKARNSGFEPPFSLQEGLDLTIKGIIREKL